MKYGYVCVAGTFDGLHAGHIAMLTQAFAVGSRVLIGLTSDTYLKQYKKNSSAASYEARLVGLSAWVASQTYGDRVRIVAIDDPFEPAVSDSILEAIVVSEQSLARGKELNRMRLLRGLKPLALSMTLMVYAEDNEPISATRVRSGVIDRLGRLTMPDSLRNDLTMPLGTVLFGEHIEASLGMHAHDEIISVGDQTTKTLLDAGVTPHFMIIDNKVNRQKFDDLRPLLARGHFDTKTVVSGPGFISGEAMNEIRRVLRDRKPDAKPFVLEVDGEEDLLALPAVLEAPIGAVVYYGQPPVPQWACGPETSGVVEVVITQERKAAAQALLAQFFR